MSGGRSEERRGNYKNKGRQGGPGGNFRHKERVLSSRTAAFASDFLGKKCLFFAVFCVDSALFLIRRCETKTMLEERRILPGFWVTAERLKRAALTQASSRR